MFNTFNGGSTCNVPLSLILHRGVAFHQVYDLSMLFLDTVVVNKNGKLLKVETR